MKFHANCLCSFARHPSRILSSWQKSKWPAGKRRVHVQPRNRRWHIRVGFLPRPPTSPLQWVYIKKRNSQCGVKSHTVQICHSNGIMILNLRLSDEYPPQRNQMNAIEDAYGFTTWTLEKEQRTIQQTKNTELFSKSKYPRILVSRLRHER